MAQVIVIGCGEAFDPQRANTSLLYRGDKTLLLDCGYSIPHALWKTSCDPSELDGIAISHIHADHSFGLPPLLLWMRIHGRKRPLQVFGGPGVESWLNTLLNLGYPGSYTSEKCFPIEAVEVPPGRAVSYGACSLDTAKTEHTVQNLAFRISENGRSMAYSGDGILTPETRTLFRDVNLLFHDSSWLDKNAYGHGSAHDLVAFAKEVGLQRLALVHVGKTERDAVRAFADSCPPHPQVMVPEPGECFDV